MKATYLIFALFLSVFAFGQSTLEIPSGERVQIAYSITESKPVATDEKEQYVSFTLRNETLKSIPLIIPGVMNPNLSPQSNSGVRLKMGQEIKYRKGLSTRILLTVDETIKEGEVVLVGELLSEVLN
jgi:hypothetical protein